VKRLSVLVVLAEPEAIARGLQTLERDPLVGLAGGCRRHSPGERRGRGAPAAAGPGLITAVRGKGRCWRTWAPAAEKPPSSWRTPSAVRGKWAAGGIPPAGAPAPHFVIPAQAGTQAAPRLVASSAAGATGFEPCHAHFAAREPMWDRLGPRLRGDDEIVGVADQLAASV
jgi:hypothetical protein